MGWLEDHLACNVVTFRDAGVRFVSKILLLTERGGTVSPVALKATKNLAGFYTADIHIGICIPMSVTLEERKRLMAKAGMTAKEFSPDTAVRVIESSSSLKDAILEVTAEFDVIVMATQSPANLGQRYFGTVQDTIIAKASCSVVCVREFDG